MYVFLLSFFLQAKKSQVLPSTLFQYQVLSQLNQLQLMHLQTPAHSHVASPHRQEQFSMLLTLPAKQALSALQAVFIASKQTRVRMCTVDLICSQKKEKEEEEEEYKSVGMKWGKCRSWFLMLEAKKTFNWQQAASSFDMLPCDLCQSVTICLLEK